MSTRQIIAKSKPVVVLLSGLLLLFTPALSFGSTRDVPIADGPPDRRFGVVEAYDAPGAAAEMGVGWTRIPFQWAQIQPNGTHEWIVPISDSALALEIAQGRQPVGLIITIPAWATDMNVGPGVPYWLHTGHNDPNNLWANFVKQLVSTYAGRIDHWIIWNEPDVWDASHPSFSWGGSVEDFLQLQRVAYLAIKETNPSATVILSGTSYWWDAAYGRDLYFRRYLDVLIQDLSAPGNQFYADAVALHVYFQPDFVYSVTALYHQLMREHGFDKPIWIVETNAAPSLDPQMPAPNGLFAITLDEQAAYIIQAFAMGIAGGATRIGVFKMIDTPTDLAANPEPFGLVRADGSHRPAFNAYRVAATYMADFESGRLEQQADASIVTITRTTGTTTVLWSRSASPTTVQVTASSGSGVLVDMWGNRRALAAAHGVYTVSLPGASCTHGAPCIIGGAPYLIVEGAPNTAPPPAAQPAPSSQDAGGDQTKVEIPTPEPIAPTTTPPPAYTVSLRPIEIKGAIDVWHKRALSGYRIELVAGPPFHLYVLTVVDEVVREAQRSLDPLTIDANALSEGKAQLADQPEMTTLYNRRALHPYTVTGLFDRVSGYFKHQPNAPACDTQITVKLNGNWAFPRLIAEEWVQDCQAEEEPSQMAVIAFSTLTPTPTRPAPTTTVTLSPTASMKPTVTDVVTGTATLTPTRFLTSSVEPDASETPLPDEPTSGADLSPFLVLLAGVVIFGALLIRRNGSHPMKHE